MKNFMSIKFAIAVGATALLFHDAFAEINAHSYIQYGLIAQWDGIDNAGTGTHDPDATTWTELKGNLPTTATALTFKDGKAAYFNGTSATGTLIEGDFPAALEAIRNGKFTADLYFMPYKYEQYAGLFNFGVDGKNRYFSLTSDGDSVIGAFQYKRSSWEAANCLSGAKPSLNEQHHVGCIANGNKHTIILDGAKISTHSAGPLTQYGTTKFCFGKYMASNKQRMKMDFFGIRLYDRVLSDVEIAYNEAIDKIRFGGVDPEADFVFPDGFRYNSESGNIESRLTASAMSDGKVSLAGAEAVENATWFLDFNNNAVLAPVPNEGYKFYYWEGDVDGVTIDAQGVATVPLNKPRALVCHFIEESHVGIKRIWRGVGDGKRWSDPNNWSPIGVPSEQDEVVVGEGVSILIEESTPEFDAITFSGTLTFTNWMTRLASKSVLIKSGATITCAGPFNDTTDMSNRVWIAASESMTLESGAKIDVNQRGYGTVTNVSARKGYGPCKAAWNGGAAYGGESVSYFGYGSAASPTDPGSSGGSRVDTKPLPPGGGAVFLDCPNATVSVMGSITANGKNGSDWNYGPSTGGSIYIRTKKFVTSGATITAIGGNREGRANSASGGRIAITYDTSLQTVEDVDSSTYISAACGKNGDNWAVPNGQPKSNGSKATDDNGRWARPGSVYFPDDRLLGKVLSNPTGFSGEIILATGKDAVISNGFTMSNGYVVFGNNLTNVTVKGDVALNGVNAYLSLGASRNLKGYSRTFIFTSDEGVAPRFEIEGNLTMTMGSRLDLHAVLTPDWNNGTPGGVLDVKGDILMSGQAYDEAKGLPALTSIVYVATCPTNGPGYHVFASNVTVGRESRFDGRQRGNQQKNTSKSNNSSLGPGRGAMTIGAGHGGAGYGANNTYGKTYGDEKRPITPGSSGVPYQNGYNTWFEGCGGAALRLTAYDTMTIAGQLLVNGETPTSGCSGGSGGSLWLEAENFSAAEGAVISAAGADALDNDSYYKAASGGGRIALWLGAPGLGYDEIAAYSEISVDTLDVVGNPFNVAGGAVPRLINEESVKAADGTLKIYSAVPRGQNLEIVSEPLDAFGACDRGYGAHTIPAGSFVCTATDVTDSQSKVRSRCIGWRIEKLNSETGEYELFQSGNTAECGFTMDNNVYRLTWKWTIEAQLTLGVAAGGTVSCTASPKDEGWYTLGDTISLEPVADNGYVFTVWGGDVAKDKMLDAPLSVTMDSAKHITCSFQQSVPGGQSFTWTGASGNGRWYDIGNWQNASGEGGLPTVGDVVAIPEDAGTILLDAPTAVLASLTLNGGATLVATNWTTAIRANTVTVLSNATITCAGPFADQYTTAYQNIDMSNRVWIVCDNLTVAPFGQINVDGKGYGDTLSVAATRAYGPGGTQSRYCGGAHGGVGNKYERDVIMKGTYDSVDDPMLPGSSGGADSGRVSAGGGVIRVEASGTVAIDGALTARGVGASGKSGGGAGGTIAIYSRKITANGGEVRACGGSGAANPNAGGGGRIAIHYDTQEQNEQDIVALALDAAPGFVNATSASYRNVKARPGTVWCSDSKLFKFAGSEALKGVLVPGSEGELTLGGLCVTNTYLSLGAQVTNVHITGNLAIVGPTTRFWFGAGDFLVNSTEKPRFTAAVNAPYVLNVDGDIIVSGGASADFLPAPTNGVDGAKGALISAGGDFIVEGSGSVTSIVRVSAHPICGSTVHFTAANVAVRASGWVSADDRTWAIRPGAWGDGRGPGKGVSHSQHSYLATGSSHGGLGVRATGKTYDSELRPAMGGSSGESNWDWGNEGGGYIHIRARKRFTLDGRISADSTTTVSGRGVAGSGGGILLESRRFSAGLAASLTAKGSSTTYTSGSGPGPAGGGGRIAVWTGEAWTPDMNIKKVCRDVDPAELFANPDSVSASGGSTGDPNISAEDGTVRCIEARMPGMVIIVR